METNSPSSFLARNEFLIRRLFSLCGLVPVGAYMVVHLVVNSSLLDGAAAYQRNVYQIHSLGKMLPIVEWVFIFIPIIFHAILGVVIIRGGLPNTGTYNYGSNIRYTLQRATGMIAFAFIFLHVFHMHGWFHFDAWLKTVEAMGGANFKPFNAGSSLAEAMQRSMAWTALYAVGVLSCVFHLSNGIWSFGIRWGIWITPAAMKRATIACTGFGVALAFVAVGSILAPWATKVEEARDVENSMLEDRLKSRDIDAATADKKRWKDKTPATADSSSQKSNEATETNSSEKPKSDSKGPNG